MLIAFFICVDDLIAEELSTPTSVRPAATKAERGEAPRLILWSVLAPDNGKPFNDPFAKLTPEQLENLSFVVRVQRLIAENKIEADRRRCDRGCRICSQADGRRRSTSDG